MKRVQFETAKALKEAGFPQEYGEGSMYYSEDGKRFEYDSELYPMFPEVFCVCPYAMEVWLWLWREKRIEIEILNDGVGLTSQIRIQGRPQFFNNDPEKAIESAINYLVEHNLIK